MASMASGPGVKAVTGQHRFEEGRQPAASQQWSGRKFAAILLSPDTGTAETGTETEALQSEGPFHPVA